MAYFVICYDITNDKRRRRVVKALGNWGGKRVQYSVFEIRLSKKKLEQILTELEKLIYKKQDSLSVYELCATCRPKAIRRGLSGKLPDKAVVVA